MNCAAHSLTHGPKSALAISSSPQIRATSRRRSGSVTTTSRWPWLNPADGVRCASRAIRSITSRSTPPSSNRRTARRFITTSSNSIGPLLGFDGGGPFR